MRVELVTSQKFYRYPGLLRVYTPELIKDYPERLYHQALSRYRAWMNSAVTNNQILRLTVYNHGDITHDWIRDKGENTMGLLNDLANASSQYAPWLDGEFKEEVIKNELTFDITEVRFVEGDKKNASSKDKWYITITLLGNELDDKHPNPSKFARQWVLTLANDETREAMFSAFTEKQASLPYGPCHLIRRGAQYQMIVDAE